MHISTIREARVSPPSHALVRWEFSGPLPLKKENGFGEGISVIVRCEAGMVVGAVITAVRLKRIALDEQK